MKKVTSIPEDFLTGTTLPTDFYIYDFKMDSEIVKSKVHLTQHVFSFLQVGSKNVHLEEAYVAVNSNQSVLLKAGNCLMTELPEVNSCYFCKLFFFTNQHLYDFLQKHFPIVILEKQSATISPFFIIQNDTYIDLFIKSIDSILKFENQSTTAFLGSKFEEIMLYLCGKYGKNFVSYLQSIVFKDATSSFKKIIEANIYSNLNLVELAFLSNRSLSTFKRHFEQEYGEKPGKWFKKNRLELAKQLLLSKEKTASELAYFLGYTNLANFSNAFKKEFGFSPKNVLD